MEKECIVQDPKPLFELLRERGVDLALDILVGGLAAACVFLTLVFVAAAVIGAVAGFGRIGTSARLTMDELR